MPGKAPPLWKEILRTLLSLVSRPGLTMGITLSLSLGIGMTTTVFSLIEATLFQPIPALPQPDRVLIVGSSTKGNSEPNGYLSYLDCKELASEATSFSKVVAFATFDVNMDEQGSIERVRVAAVESDYFAVVGSGPSEGRLSWTKEQEVYPVAVISEGLRRRLFSQEEVVPGRSLFLNGIRFDISGVAARGFRGVDRVDPIDVWVPLSAYSRLASGPLAILSGTLDGEREWLRLVGRLKPKSSLELAQRELTILERRLARHYSDSNSNKKFVAVTAQEFAFGPGGRARLKRYLTILMLVASLAVLISIGTVANLLLARAFGRQEEFAIRLCLGAKRGHLVKLLLVEGLILAFIGGLGGGALAAAALPVFKHVRLPVQATVAPELNLGVVIFAFLTAVLVSLLASLLPAFRLTKPGALSAIRRQTPSTQWQRRLAPIDLLVIAHMGVAFMLLVGAGLFLRTLQKLDSADLGFEPARLLVFDLDIGFLDLSPANSAVVYEDVLSRIRSLPSVKRASLVGGIPILGGALDVRLSMTVEGIKPRNEEFAVTYALVSPGYFKTVGTPIVRGREFSANDGPGAPLVVILDQTLVQQYQIPGDPVGTSVRLAQGEGPFEVVGVAGKTTPADSRETDSPVLYLAYPQLQSSFVGNLMATSMSVVIQAAGDRSTVIPDIRQAVQSVEKKLPPVDIATVESRLADLAAIERQAGGFFSVLGCVIYALALVGLYALMTQAVLHRRKELAIRMAVGAGPGTVLKLVVRRGLGLTFAALALGAPAAWTLGRLAQSRLFGVSAGDPVTFTVVAVSQTAFALLVALLPAWRATQIDVCDGLRSGTG